MFLKFVLLFVGLAAFYGPADSRYMITSPRRWTMKSSSQVCVVLTEGAFAPTDSLSYSLTEVKLKVVLQPDKNIPLPEGETNSCIDVPVPHADERHVTLAIKGSLAGDQISDSFNLTFVEKPFRTFIQTDKYLYKPGQTVQFRILSVQGPNLDVVTEKYEEVYITSPSNTRIAQWLNVTNTAGLVHLSFELYDEIEVGTYTITAKVPNSNLEEKRFRVEDYVLPRYEVTINSPKPILGSDKNVTVTLCAKYTFGEPVNGNATLSLAAGSWRIYANLTESANISGCKNFTFPTDKLRFDDNNCHIRVDQLKANAIVAEEGTGVELSGANNYIPVHRRAVQFRDESAPWTMKPYLPYAAKIATTYPNKEPARNEPMEVCIRHEERICKNLTTCNYGYLTFVMPSQVESRVEVKAINYPRIEKNWNNVMEESSYYKYSHRSEEYVDPTNSSLTIYVEGKVDCTTGQEIEVTIPVLYVVFNQSEADLHVQISSRGQVVFYNITKVNFVTTDLPFNTKDQLLPLETVPDLVNRGVANVSVTLPTSVSPKISVLVWYTSADDVVVADSTEIQITECLPHKVDFTWSTEKVEPGKEANLILTAASDALCSIGVVDKSVELLSSQNNKLDIQSILQVTYNSEVARWDSDQLNLDYCLAKYPQTKPEKAEGSDATGGETAAASEALRTSPVTFHRYGMMEALHMFNSAGYFVFSNLVTESLFCDHLITQDLKNKFEGSSVGGFGGGIAPPVAISAEKGSVSSFSPQSQERPVAVAAFDSPGLVGTRTKEGVAENKERSYLPETWLWQLTPVPATGEVNDSTTLPDSITEWVGRAVCVHPEEGVGISQTSSITTFTSFFVDLTLPSSATRGENLPVKISVFNYLDEDLPVKVMVEPSEEYQILDEKNGVREICVLAKTKVVQDISVNMTKIGDTNLTIEATTNALLGSTCGSGTPPAKTDRFIRSIPVEAEGYSREKTWNKYVCSQDVQNGEGAVATWNLEAPEAIVEGSDRAWITAIGDLLGPSVENINNLIRFPSGCGEQNMVKFAPNVFILQYLNATKQTSEAIVSKLKKFLANGYQRQLLFRHSKDSSYSAFGERDLNGSTWLTAFVVKSFAQAKPYTFIDDKALEKSANWLKNLQEKDGCFTSRGRVINKMLQGGIRTSGGSRGLLTAYVLAALIEEGSVNDTTIASALKCIDTETSEHPYTLALKAYTLALAKAPNTKTIIDQLIAAAVSNSSDMRWTLPDRKGQNTALHVETAAYALLALVTFDPTTYSQESRKIVRWISGLRNGQGGFVSTQDTVVALQALAAFEKAQPSKTLDMVVKATGTDFAHNFSVMESNKLLQQRVDIPSLPLTLNLDISGQGCALVQGVLRYNVLADSPNDAFQLRVETKDVPNDCNTKEITACASYTLSDGASNMAIIEVKLVSGYIPEKADLKLVVGDGKGLFKKYEVDLPKVIFYLDEINKDEICATFKVFQEIEIGNAKPGTVSVFDYYQPELISTQKYTFPSCQ